MSRDVEVIDAELRLVAALRAVCDPPPSTAKADELLDERNAKKPLTLEE